ncbi:MAG: hypothetical protein N2Z58_01290 [Fervidobacterium sp.]|nr:hypothetical protein [Fervidobacterium sp.]
MVKSEKIQKIIILALLSTLSTIIFSISQKAIEYYSAAELSYKSGDYTTALRNYELALTTDPTIEGFDSYVKFKMGISAYMVGNYDKARSYLSSYNTGFVKELLSSIDKRQAQDEWKRWIMKHKPAQSEIPTQTSYVTPKSKPINFMLPIIVFLIIFVTLIVAEIRILKIRKRVIELPLKPEQARDVVSVQPVAQTTEERKKEVLVEAEGVELIPENAKLVDFETLLSSDIDVFKELLEASTSTEEITEVLAKEEQKTEDLVIQKNVEETIEDRKILIEEVLHESKQLIDGLLPETRAAVETSADVSVELSGLESKFIEKLKEYVEKSITERAMGIEELEKIQKDFSYFDDLEKITDEDSRLLVKKLVSIHRGENS